MRSMNITPLLLLTALPALYAQNTTVVQVGGSASTEGGIFQFIPPTVTASKGDVIMFNFSGAPGNHSVTQSTLSDPCTPMDGGFDSGWVFIPQNGVGGETPMWNLTVTDDSKPLWFYCKQLQPSPHCLGGMLGAVNAPSTGDNTFQAFQQNAQNFDGTPGQGIGALVGQGASASADPGPLTNGAALAGTPAASATSPAGTGANSGSGTITSTGGASGSGSGAPSSTPDAAMSNTVTGWAGLIGLVMGIGMVQV